MINDAKALEKSRDTPITNYLFTNDCVVLSISNMRAMYVEWFFLNPNWFSYMIFRFSRKVINLVYSIFSKTFDGMHSNDTNRLWLKHIRSSDLHNGMAFANSSCWGNNPSCNDWLQTLVSGWEMNYIDNLKNFVQISSHPHAEFF